MVELLSKEKSRFRIVIKDLETGKTKCISLLNHEDYNISRLKEDIERCLSKPN